MWPVPAAIEPVYIIRHLDAAQLLYAFVPMWFNRRVVSHFQIAPLTHFTSMWPVLAAMEPVYITRHLDAAELLHAFVPMWFNWRIVSHFQIFKLLH